MSVQPTLGGREHTPLPAGLQDFGPNAAPLRPAGRPIPNGHLLDHDVGVPKSHLRGPRRGWARIVEGPWRPRPRSGSRLGSPRGRVPYGRERRSDPDPGSVVGLTSPGAGTIPHRTRRPGGHVGPPCGDRTALRSFRSCVSTPSNRETTATYSQSRSRPRASAVACRRKELRGSRNARTNR